MNETAIRAAKIIEEQQKELSETSPAFFVGEQLKEIAERDPRSAELLVTDLAVPEMHIREAEKKIHTYADAHRNGKNYACVPPKVAEEILREFYGLPIPEKSISEMKEADTSAKYIDLSSFL